MPDSLISPHSMKHCKLAATTSATTMPAYGAFTFDPLDTGLVVVLGGPDSRL
jgi:hypothetical protein